MCHQYLSLYQNEGKMKGYKQCHFVLATYWVSAQLPAELVFLYSPPTKSSYRKALLHVCHILIILFTHSSR